MLECKSVVRKILFAGALVFAHAAYGEEVRVHHSQGETLVPSPPTQVAVLDMASLDTLDALEVEVRGVPSGLFAPYLSKYNDARYRKIGSMFEPDYEALNAMAPDLIIIGGRSSPKYNNVSKLAPTIDLSPDVSHRLESAISHAESLGRVFHKEARARTLIRKLRSSIAVVRTQAAATGTGLLVMTGGGKMGALGPGSWFGTLYDDFGIKPAVEDLQFQGHGQSISPEFLLKTNPDWIFVIDRDAATGESGISARQLLDNDLVHQTKAWQAGHVVFLNPAYWYIVGDGLTALQGMVDEISNALPPAK